MNTVTSAQREIDFSDAARLAAHLVRCGLSAVQAGLVGLVVSRGAWRQCGNERYRVLTISSREAAASLGCSDRAVAKAAATLTRWDWFRELKGTRGKPPAYVVDPAAAASVATLVDRLDELWEPDTPPAGANRCEPVRTSANQCEPVRTGANLSPCSSRETKTKPVFSPHPCSDTGSAASAHEFAPVRSGAQTTSPRPSAPGPSPLPNYPWSRAAGVSDAALVEACRRGDVRLLRHLFDHAVQMEWIVAPSDDTWQRFLTACHHAATARLARRMGRLVAFVKNGLDVSRCTQRSDQWAGELLAKAHRDPGLVRLGLLCGRSEGGGAMFIDDLE